VLCEAGIILPSPVRVSVSQSVCLSVCVCVRAENGESTDQ